MRNNDIFQLENYIIDIAEIEQETGISVTSNLNLLKNIISKTVLSFELTFPPFIQVCVFML